jgi:choline dehydrogenase-like flavoprotein
VVATGVEFINGTTTQIIVRHILNKVECRLHSPVLQGAKNVIVSAGALNTPKVLELSGIGDPAVLQGYAPSPFAWHLTDAYINK